MAVEDECFSIARQRIVTERVQVGIGAVVNAETDDVQSAADAAGVGVVKHFVLGGTEVKVVGGLLQIGKVRERDGYTILHQTRRLHFLLGRDQVQRAALVILAPAAPVGEFRFPAVHLFDGYLGMRGIHAIGPSVKRSQRAECQDGNNRRRGES
jgi:hypothetical protein